ncbi:hypothetical protein [Bosea beijingensis]
MAIKQGLPEGRNIRLQEAITWAYTGWSWSNATASLNDISELERRADFPAPNSIYALIPDVPREHSLERDGALFSRFDESLGEACFRGEIALTGRRIGSKNFEAIPHTYFFKPRGFSYLYGDRIDDTPTNASLDVIFAHRDDGDWEDAIVDRDQFLTWFNKAKAHIVGVADIPDTSPTIYRTGAPGRPTSMRVVLEEAERRLEAGVEVGKLLPFAKELARWLTVEHEKAPPLKPETIADNPEFKTIVRRFQTERLETAKKTD